MNILVTAGNTLVMLDKVRCLTNVFSGKTGAGIALQAYARQHTVTLLTSHVEAVRDLTNGKPPAGPGWRVETYRTFENLRDLLARHVRDQPPDALIHSAAVSDYLADGVYSPAEGSNFDSTTGTWQGTPPTLHDRAAGKIKSDEPELWVRLVRAPKLIDLFRSEWGYRGLLVKFKLEVGKTDEELLAIAERSRVHSRADLMVANTLEGAASHAFLGAGPGTYQRVGRRELLSRLIETLEQLAPSK